MSMGSLLCIILVFGWTSAYSNLEEKLLDNLLRNYSSSRRPVRNSSLPVEVIVGFEISKFLELHEPTETLEVAGWMNLVWMDEFLTWNPDFYGGITSLPIGYNLIWRPDVVIMNSADSFFKEDWYHFTGLRVMHNGEVHWFPGGKFALSCPMDVIGFPYDDQMCDIQITTWITDINQTKLINAYNKIRISIGATNGQWDIVNTSAVTVATEVDMVVSPSEGDKEHRMVYSKVIMKLFLCRKYQRILLYKQIPSIVTSGLAGVAFIIPPQFAEKVSVAFSSLVSFTVFIIGVLQNLPKSSDDLPIFSLYMVFQILSVALVMIFEAIVVNLYHRKENKNMEGRIWVIKHLGPLVRVKAPNHVTDTVKEADKDKDQEENPDCSSEQIKEGKTNNDDLIQNISKEWQTTALIFDRLFFMIWALMNIVAFALIHGFIY